jgi:glutathione synthase/RimK-type ligase-like ATP-grasp enzyme
MNPEEHCQPASAAPPGPRIPMVDMPAPKVFALASLLHMTPPQLQGLIAEVHGGSDLARTYLQMYYMFLLSNQHDAALDMQAKALALQRLFRIEGSRNARLRVLVLMGPGHMQANTPIELVLAHCAVQTEILFLLPGEPLPQALPLHDVAFVAIGESAQNAHLLALLQAALARWPVPVVNQPAAIPNGSRDTCYRLLKDIARVRMPQTQRLCQGDALQMAYPITLRPIDTHGGEGLERVDDAQQLAHYYARYPASAYYAAHYVDCQSPDGCYRKFRIVLIDGVPYVCHLAISAHWVVHYQSAGMGESLAKRQEEQRFMEGFDQDLALRFGAALSAIARALQLDYVTLDCAETPDGYLLVFEVDSRGLVHAADPVDVFPYKPAVMQKAFDAFERLLRKRAGQGAIGTTTVPA